MSGLEPTRAMPLPVFANPDQELIHRFVDGGLHELPMDSNPMAQALQGCLVSMDRTSGRAEIRFTPQSLFVQGNGVLQGGAVTAMLDFAMAFATLAHLPPTSNCATVHLSAAFVRPAPQGSYLATGQVDRCGRTMAFAQARLVNVETGQLVATASSSLAVMS